MSLNNVNPKLDDLDNYYIDKTLVDYGISYEHNTKFGLCRECNLHDRLTINKIHYYIYHECLKDCILHDNPSWDLFDFYQQIHNEFHIKRSAIKYAIHNENINKYFTTDNIIELSDIFQVPGNAMDSETHIMDYIRSWLDKLPINPKNKYRM